MDNYERKVRKIKKSIKNLVVENATFCDQLVEVQNSIDVCKQEREFLLRKLVEHDPSIDTQNAEPKMKKRKNSDSSNVKKNHQSLLKNPMPKMTTTLDGSISNHYNN